SRWTTRWARRPRRPMSWPCTRPWTTWPSCIRGPLRWWRPAISAASPTRKRPPHWGSAKPRSRATGALPGRGWRRNWAAEVGLDWDELQRKFEQVSGASPVQREAMLDEIGSGDPDLAARLRRMLQHDVTPNPLL